MLSLRFSTRDMVAEEIFGVCILGEGAESGDEWVWGVVDLGLGQGEGGED